MIIAGSNLRISMSIGEDITGATATISYINQSDTGTWPALIADAETGTIFYDMNPAELSVLGKWSVWATYVLADAKVIKTPAKQFTVYAEGTVQP
jgi:hypothetical protein